MMTHFRILCAAACAAVMFVAGSASWAASPISVEVGKSRVMHISGDAAVVMIGEPTIADVIVERNGLLFLLGRQTGETNLFILDHEGKTVLSTDVVVTPIGARHVTVNRGTTEASVTCNPRCAPVPTLVTKGTVNQAGPGDENGGGSAGLPPQEQAPPTTNAPTKAPQ